MTSTRLPGKVLLPAGGKPMLSHLVNRLRHVPSLNEIVLATTINDTDQVLVDFAKEEGIRCFRGSEEDVMSRVVGAGEFAQADVIVQITGDCPIIDPAIVEQTIRLFLHNDCDFAGNAEIPGYPIGMGTLVFKLSTLKTSFAMTIDKLDREHVTRHIRLNPQLFKGIKLPPPPDLDWPDLALTLDEQADYVLLKTIIEYFGDRKSLFSCNDVIILLRSIHPEWATINQEVRRKGLN